MLSCMTKILYSRQAADEIGELVDLLANISIEAFRV